MYRNSDPRHLFSPPPRNPFFIFYFKSSKRMNSISWTPGHLQKIFQFNLMFQKPWSLFSLLSLSGKLKDTLLFIKSYSQFQNEKKDSNYLSFPVLHFFDNKKEGGVFLIELFVTLLGLNNCSTRESTTPNPHHLSSIIIWPRATSSN